jgi:signal peptidase I
MVLLCTAWCSSIWMVFILTIHVVPVYYVPSAAMVAHIDFVSARISHL